MIFHENSLISALRFMNYDNVFCAILDEEFKTSNAVVQQYILERLKTAISWYIETE